jgi:hypothetical protein
MNYDYVMHSVLFLSAKCLRSYVISFGLRTNKHYYYYATLLIGVVRSIGQYFVLSV